MGGGTQLQLGNVPKVPFAIVDLASIQPVSIEHQTNDLTIVTSANATLGEISDVLTASGQRLPLDPALARHVTVGGLLAVGQSGPLRTRFGLPRDFVLGMTVMRPDGELVNAGGRVVKNVTGYDLMRLWTGSLGTLGITTQAAFKVLPSTETIDLRVDYANCESLWKDAQALSRGDVRPEILDARLVEERSWRVLLRVEAAAEITTRNIIAGSNPDYADDSAYTSARDFGFQPGDALTLRLSTLPEHTLGIAVSIQAQLPGMRVLARPLTGQVRATTTEPPSIEIVAAALAALRTRVASFQGGVVVERMPDDFRKQVDAWGSTGTAPLMSKVKRTFDPAGRLNAGRFCDGI
jgi:glycolate oxidase FAD binding subunit